MKMPCRWQRSSKKSMKPSPCEWERKSDSLPTAPPPQCLRKLSAHHLGRLGMVDGPEALAAAGVVIAGEHRDPLEQSGFAAAVFTDDDGDRLVEAQLEVIVQERKAERIRLAAGDARWIEPDSPQVRRRHPNVALSFRTHAPCSAPPG